MGLRDWLGRSSPTRLQALESKGDWWNVPAVVYPAPAGNGWVDLPVERPWGGVTTAWSGQVPVLDPPTSLTEAAANLRGLDPIVVWKTQPSVRKVVDFIARAVASTPIRVYNRKSDDVRTRESNSDLAWLLRHPAPRTIPFRHWHATMSDWLLYDRWATKVIPADNQAGFEMIRIPARSLRFKTDRLDRVTAVGIFTGEFERYENGIRWESPDDYLYDFGYRPDTGGGLTPMETLSEVLAERMEAIHWRRQIWANGARMSGWIERPVEASEIEGWDQAARERFLSEFEDQYTRGGSKVGGVPMLEDGMTYHDAKTFSADDMDDLEHRKLSDVEVTSAYHIAPELVGAREGNYSNVKEYRQQLYRDALGGYFAPIKQVLNAMLVPRLAGRKRLYTDFDLNSKLRGSFEERAALTSTAVGGPWLTRNEARAEDNLAPIDGGDEIITPLNVTIGGQPSPQTPTGDGGDSEPSKAIGRGVKGVVLPEPTRDRLLADFTSDLDAFVGRQRAAVTSALGAKSIPPLASAWNKTRWERELAAVLTKHLMRSAELRGTLVATQLDSKIDLDALLMLVTGRATDIASPWNEKTYQQLAEAVQEPDWKTAVAAVFEATANRTGRLAQSTTTELTSRAALLAADGAGPLLKRWSVRSRSPRASHKAMAGETVPLDGVFSNGARHPGDGNLPTAERAHCTCDVEILRED